MTNKQTPQLVQDRKTGEWYNPEEKMRELFQQNWFVALLQRMKNRWKLWYNSLMNTQDKIYAVWAMNGAYYDAVMNSIPNWVTDDIIDDWFYSQLGM